MITPSIHPAKTCGNDTVRKRWIQASLGKPPEGREGQTYEVCLGTETSSICGSDLWHNDGRDNGGGLGPGDGVGHGVASQLRGGDLGGHDVGQGVEGGAPEEVEHEGAGGNSDSVRGVRDAECETTGNDVEDEEHAHAAHGERATAEPLDDQRGDAAAGEGAAGGDDGEGKGRGDVDVLQEDGGVGGGEEDAGDLVEGEEGAGGDGALDVLAVKDVPERDVVGEGALVVLAELHDAELIGDLGIRVATELAEGGEGLVEPVLSDEPLGGLGQDEGGRDEKGREGALDGQRNLVREGICAGARGEDDAGRNDSREQVHDVDTGDDTATDRDGDDLGQVEGRGRVGDTHRDGDNRTAADKGAQVRGEDLQEGAADRDDVGNEERPFPAEVVVQGVCEEGANDGPDQRDGEEQRLVPGREDELSCCFVYSLVFLDLGDENRRGQPRAPCPHTLALALYILTNGFRAMIGEITLSSYPNRNEAAANVTQAKML